MQTSNLIINLDHDEWILNDDSKTLADTGFGEFLSPRTFLISPTSPHLSAFDILCDASKLSGVFADVSFTYYHGQPRNADFSSRFIQRMRQRFPSSTMTCIKSSKKTRRYASYHDVRGSINMLIIFRAFLDSLGLIIDLINHTPSHYSGRLFPLG